MGEGTGGAEDSAAAVTEATAAASNSRRGSGGRWRDAGHGRRVEPVGDCAGRDHDGEAGGGELVGGPGRRRRSGGRRGRLDTERCGGVGLLEVEGARHSGEGHAASETVRGKGGEGGARDPERRPENAGPIQGVNPDPCECSRHESQW